MTKAGEITASSDGFSRRQVCPSCHCERIEAISHFFGQLAWGEEAGAEIRKVASSLALLAMTVFLDVREVQPMTAFHWRLGRLGR